MSENRNADEPLDLEPLSAPDSAPSEDRAGGSSPLGERRCEPEAPRAERAAPGTERLLEHPSVAVWARCYWDSAVPILLLDGTLHVIWANRSFQLLFGDMSSYLGHALLDIFGSSFDEARRAELLSAVSSSDRSYSWRGMVSRKDRRRLVIVAHLLVLPIYHSPRSADSPMAYVTLVDDLSDHQRRLLRDTFASLLEASKLRDMDTGHHIERVNAYCRLLGERLLGRPLYPQVDRQYVEDIGFLAAMHDVGKIGVSDNILNKSGPLEDWEWTLMKEHTINGAYLLATYPNPMAREIALFHHEWWDGSGYPYGLAGDMIPLAARIVAIADVYDALRTRRTYKEAIEHGPTIEIMQENAGSHFDPSLVEHFMAVHRDFRDIYASLHD